MLDIIIRANFGVKKLRGLGNTRGQILEFPIEMAGQPYNSAALPRSLWLTNTWSTNQEIIQSKNNYVQEWPIMHNMRINKNRKNVRIFNKKPSCR